MMRFLTYLYIALLSLISLLGCSKKEEFEGERVDVRLAELLASYEEQLTGATNGWIGYLYPAGGGGYTFKFSFDANNRVKMYATVKEAYATTAKESSYRLRATQVPSLYFDTYSYIHELADPDPTVADGATGQGHLSDFEFAILGVSPDTIRLKGNLNGSELLLVRAGESEGEGFTASAYAQLEKIRSIETFPYYHNQFTAGTKNYNISFNPDIQTVSFYAEGRDTATFTSSYVATVEGIVLRKPFVDGSLEVAYLKGLTVDVASHIIRADAGGQTIATVNRPAPAVVDTDAPQRMYKESYQYISWTGFTVNGVSDGLGISGISGFVAVTFYPRRYLDGYDAFFIYWNDAQNYVGPAVKTELTADGRLLFGPLAGYGSNGSTNQLTEEEIALIERLTDQVLSEPGYYAYQTGPTSYDLVSVADSRIWIRFN